MSTASLRSSKTASTSSGRARTALPTHTWTRDCFGTSVCSERLYPRWECWLKFCPFHSYKAYASESFELSHFGIAGVNMCISYCNCLNSEWYKNNMMTSLPPPRRLCFCQSLFVCLSVSKITQKVMDGSFWNIFWECREWQKLPVIQFWGWSGRNPGFWITLLTLLSMGHKGNRCQTEYGAATWRTTWRWRRCAVSDCFLVLSLFVTNHASCLAEQQMGHNSTSAFARRQCNLTVCKSDDVLR